MAKKKSKGFIIPAIHFLTTSVKKKSTAVQTTPTSSETGATATRPRPSAASKTEGQSGVAPTGGMDAAPTEKGKVQPPKVEGKKPDRPEPEKKKLDTNPRSRRKSALSLSSLKRNKEEEEEKKRALAEKQEKVKLPEDPFDQGKFDGIWNDYIEGLHQKGEKILASILSADHPRIVDQMIHVTYPNKLMKKELLRVRPRVLKDLRAKLNNYKMDFRIEVKEENVKRFAYTPQEKYELLREKNKDLSLLRKTFNLEL